MSSSDVDGWRVLRRTGAVNRIRLAPVPVLQEAAKSTAKIAPRAWFRRRAVG
jgi:hypothetical protein